MRVQVVVQAFQLASCTATYRRCALNMLLNFIVVCILGHMFSYDVRNEGISYCTGVEVEVVVPAVQTAPRIAATEDIGAVALLHSYATAVGMSQPALAAALDLLRVSTNLVCA